MKALHIIISGRVQGVGFRVSTQNHARELGVSGWVKNLPDGRVEMVVQGDDAQLERMLAWCMTGPSGAQVAGIEKTDHELLSTTKFDIRL